MSLTRVPGSHHAQSRPLRPRTAPGPCSISSSKPSTVSQSSSQQPPSSKSSITSVVAPSDHQTQTKTKDSCALEDGNEVAKSEPPAPKRGAVSVNKSQTDHGKPSSASKPHQRKASAES